MQQRSCEEVKNSAGRTTPAKDKPLAILFSIALGPSFISHKPWLFGLSSMRMKEI